MVINKFPISFLIKPSVFLEEKTSKTIKAHQSPLSCLELNAKGTKLATASEKV